jgi:hypothetical protein
LIDKNTFMQLDASIGSGINLTQASETQRTAMQEAGATTRTAMQEAGATTRAGMGATTIGGPGGGPEVVPLSSIQPGGAHYNAPGYDTGVAQKAMQPVVVGGGGPGGTGGVMGTVGQVQPGGRFAGAPAYNQQVDTAMNTPVRVFGVGADGKPDPGNIQTITAGQAIRDGRQVIPEDLNKVQAAVVQAGVAGGGPGAAQRFVSGVNATTPPKPLSPDESNLLNFRANQTAQTVYAPTEQQANRPMGFRTEPAQLTPEAALAVQSRATELINSNPVYRQNPDLATQQAFMDLRANGNLPMTVDRSRGFQWGNPQINEQINRGQVKGSFMVPLVKPYQPGSIPLAAPQQLKPGQPAIAGQPQPPPPLRGQVSTATRAVPIGRAPAGTPDGTTMKLGNQTGVARGGLVYAQ